MTAWNETLAVNPAVAAATDAKHPDAGLLCRQRLLWEMAHMFEAICFISSQNGRRRCCYKLPLTLGNALIDRYLPVAVVADGGLVA